MEAELRTLAVSVYTVPTSTPESDGTLTWDSTSVVVAEPTAGGERGLGFSYATPACARLIEDLLSPAVLGRDALDVPGAWSAMVKAIRNVGRPGVASMAIASVDIALWDLKAKLLKLPLAAVLGRVRDRVPVYGSGGFTSLSDAELRAQLETWIGAEGITRVKIKVGEDWGRRPERDLSRARLARETVSDEVALMVDANGGYQLGQALRMARAYEELGVDWFEEPVSSDPLAGLRRVRESTTLDVAAGEYGYDLVYFERMCAAGAVDCLQVDVSRCAGVTEWLRVAAVAAAHGLEVSGHCAPSLHLQPALSVPNLRHVEYFWDHALLDRVLFDGVIAPSSGALKPELDRPGIGLELKREDAERFRARA